MIVCWWSGGITSAVACKIAIEQNPLVRVIFLDTGNEDEDTYRFLKDCEKWYGVEIESLSSDKYDTIQDTWYRHKSLNTAKGAICSYKLKRCVREDWEKKNDFDHQVFGFEYDKKEINRAKSLKMNHPQTDPIFPLIENKLSKKDCLQRIQDAGLLVPRAYRLGFSNNNCLKTGCVQGGIGYWKKIQKDFPDKFEKMAKVEHDLSDLRGKPVTMLKDQSNAAKASGNQLVFLKKHADFPDTKTIDDMSGRPVKPLEDCNGFCGVNDLIEREQTELELNNED